jgi:hypothetical protein
MRISVIGLTLLSALLVGPAFAQAPATPAAPATDKATLSKSCSTQADAKGLHGKARKHFRSACKRGH